MSNFEKELLESADTIYLPNRYLEPFVEAVGNITNIDIPDIIGRKGSVESNGRTFRWVRGRDVPKIVASAQAAKPGSKVVGLTGSDWCDEYMLGELTGMVAANRRIDYYNIPGAKLMGRVAIIAPPSVDAGRMLDEIQPGRKQLVPVVTVYPNLGTASSLSITTSIEFTVNGSVETVADDLGMLALDVICTGETARQNGFTVLAELQDAFPAIVVAAGANTA